MIVRQTLDNSLRVVTEAMPHVRSVSIGVWLTRGSRHELEPVGGIAHFVEHMLFKGTVNRSAEDIAQTIDSIGGQLDAFTSKEYAGYYIKVLDEHLPLAIELLSDVILRPAFAEEDIEREKKVILEEIKMVEDTPDDLVHEMFTQSFWEGHPLGRPILGLKETVEAFTQPVLRDYFAKTYVARNLVIAAAGNLQHESFRDLIAASFSEVGQDGSGTDDQAPPVFSRLLTREKELEQSHLVLGTRAYPQNHEARYALYILNTLLGGSMSSRLFQNIREKRGLAYAVFSGLAAYRDAGMLSVYAGCANESVSEVLDLVVEELRGLKREALPAEEIRRAKDHLKGNLMLSLESTSSRMTHLARQDIYFDQHFTLDETLAGIERVTADDVHGVAIDLFSNGALGATILGAPGLAEMDASRLHLD